MNEGMDRYERFLGIVYQLAAAVRQGRTDALGRTGSLLFIALQCSQLERDNNDFNKGIVVRKEHVTGKTQSKPLSPSKNEHCARQGHRYNADVAIDGSSAFTVRDQI